MQNGLEGIVSKRRSQPYSPGRGNGWPKTKCLLRQELVRERAAHLNR